MGRIRGVSMTLVLVVGAAFAPGTVASADTCQVVNLRTGSSYRILQRAVDEATRGDTLEIRRRCVGSTVIEGKALVLQGVAYGGYAKATLDGDGDGRVLFLTRGRLEIRDLWITGGTARAGAGIRIVRGASLLVGGATSIVGNVTTKGGSGGGIFAPGAAVTMDDTAAVSANQAWYGVGGGIFAQGGTVSLNGSSSVSGNRGRSGGIYAPGGSVTLGGTSFVSRNLSRDQGGGISAMSGSVVINDSSSVSGNVGGGIGATHVALNDEASVEKNVGGGISVFSWSGEPSDVTLNDHASVSGNRPQGGYGGSGITAAWESVVTLNGWSVVEGNSTSGGGGGINGSADIRLNGSSTVRDNEALYGGGIVYMGLLTLRGSASVVDNRATGGSGGGIISGADPVSPVRVCTAQVAISPNDPDDPPPTVPCT